MDKQEKSKKILIILVMLILFGVSYYYYFYNQETPTAAKASTKVKTESKQKKAVDKKVVLKPPALKPVLKKHNKPVLKQGKTIEEKKPEKTAVKKEIPVKKQPEIKKFTIKPTDLSSIRKLAAGTSGKKDPFSYQGSSISSPTRAVKGGNNLPMPPRMNEKAQQSESPQNTIEIKGFMGNKAIVQINGVTEALSAGQSIQGNKILSVNPQDRSCVFMHNGKKIIKTMKPIVPLNNGVNIKYLNN